VPCGTRAAAARRRLPADECACRRPAARERTTRRVLRDVTVDAPAVLLRNRVGHRQPEARAFPDRLRREKRIEDLRLQHRRHPGAVVIHFQDRPRRDPGWCHDRRIIVPRPCVSACACSALMMRLSRTC
jgi:hypothetical protein